MVNSVVPVCNLDTVISIDVARFKIHFYERKAFSEIGQAIGRSAWFVRRVLLENG
jgi:hypothetical protein